MLIVQKYGGTSVGSIERMQKVAERCIATAKQGHQVAVVVSAMSGETNRLLELTRQIHDDPNDREVDVIISTGEQVSVGLIALAIRKAGGKARSFLGHQCKIVTDSSFSRARIVSIESQPIKEALGAGEIAVIAGFQGVDEKGSITTLGRGGSDTTAVALAGALRADYCEICSDVDGVYTADPRVVDAAQLLHSISHDEMLELAAQGAKVLHDASVEFARRSGIALYARATNKDGGGTRVDFTPERERVVAAVTGQNNLIRMRVSGGAAVEHCLQILETASIPLTHLDLEGKELRVWFTIADVPDWAEVRKRLDNVLADQVEFGEEGAVTIVGHGIGSNPGVINKARQAAFGAGVPLNAVSVSPLRVTLWCDRQHVDSLTIALHKTFVE